MAQQPRGSALRRATQGVVPGGAERAGERHVRLIESLALPVNCQPACPQGVRCDTAAITAGGNWSIDKVVRTGRCPARRSSGRPGRDRDRAAMAGGHRARDQAAFGILRTPCDIVRRRRASRSGAPVAFALEQATERVPGTDERVPTQLFHGYGEFVADLYQGLDGVRLDA
jgi:hypothetical protein